MLDAPLLEFFRLLLRARLTPELGCRVFGFVVVLRPDQAVSPGNRAAVHAPDLFPDLPLGVKRLGGEDEPVDPEEYEAADEVRYDGGGQRPEAREQVEHAGEDRR